MIKNLDVLYNQIKVGTLAISNENKIVFQYDKDWINNGFSISPFKLPLIDKVFISNNRLFHGLFGVFNDGFIDSWGELIISRYLRSINKDYNSYNILEKLSIIGNNTMGGLSYRPSQNIDINIQNLNLDKIQDEINNLLNNKNSNDIDYIFKLGGSSSGTRPKIITKFKDKDVIIKFRSHIDPNNIAFLEYQYMSLAKKSGITIPYIELIKGKRNDYFLIERFDRKNNKRIHTITASGLLECDYNAPSLDYLDLIKLTKILTKNEKDVIEMYRRMVFNVVFNNQDDHAKNFSFYYDENIKMYRLAPAYDITPSTTYFNEHTTSINGKGKDISDEDMLIVAKKSNIKLELAKSIINKIRTIYKENIK